jgi:hypothetical protein
MGVQAIDQTIFPSVLGETKVFYCPRSLTSDNITLCSFQIRRGKYFDLLPALSLNNCIIFNTQTSQSSVILLVYQSILIFR